MVKSDPVSKEVLCGIVSGRLALTDRAHDRAAGRAPERFDLVKAICGHAYSMLLDDSCGEPPSTSEMATSIVNLADHILLRMAATAPPKPAEPDAADTDGSADTAQASDGDGAGPPAAPAHDAPPAGLGAHATDPSDWHDPPFAPTFTVDGTRRNMAAFAERIYRREVAAHGFDVSRLMGASFEESPAFWQRIWNAVAWEMFLASIAQLSQMVVNLAAELPAWPDEEAPAPDPDTQAEPAATSEAPIPEADGEGPGESAGPPPAAEAATGEDTLA